jgi:hypothetical protein
MRGVATNLLEDAMSRTIRKTLPGFDLEAVFARNRALFGGARMEADGDGDGGGDDGGDSGEGDGKDGGDGDDAADAEPPALIEERNARKNAVTLLSELTGKSKGEIARALKKGGDALTGLKPAEAAKDSDGGDGKEPVDAAKIKRDAEQVANERANGRIVKAEVRALAADLFADPADAHLYLDLSQYDVDDDGEVDAKAITADLKALLKAKPHLTKTGRPKPDPSQGKQGGSPEATPGIGRMRQAYASKSP